jgi:oxalate decarboxylase
MDFHNDDVGYIERSMPHHIENPGDRDLVFLEVFPAPEYSGCSLARWLAHTPSRLVEQHVGTGEDFLHKIARKETVITPG